MLCEVCGNEVSLESTICQFCGSSIENAPTGIRPRPFICKVINIKEGLPVVAVALARLTREITAAKNEGVQVLCIIHGYGSSGKGGAIRMECRKTLSHLLATGEVLMMVAGEEFSKRSGPGSALLRCFPQLSDNIYLGKHNKGVTFVRIG